MSARDERVHAPADASSWTVSPACRAFLAGRPFMLDGGVEVRVEDRVAGRRGLLSDLLVISPAYPSGIRTNATFAISVAELEAHIDAGLVSCVVEARTAFGGTGRRPGGGARGAESPARRAGFADAAGLEAAAAPRLHASRLETVAAPPPSPSTNVSRYSPRVIADVVASARFGPGVTAAAIHARLTAGWPAESGPPPSRSTVARWVRRYGGERMHAAGSQPRNMRRRPGGGRP